MPSDRDIDGAVEAGILDAAQADRLKAYFAGRDTAATDVIPAEQRDAEAVRFARGFHDIFLTIGVTLVLVGIVTTGSFLLPGPLPPIATAAAAWALAEAFTARRRLVLPSIALAVGFVVSASQIVPMTVDGGQMQPLSSSSQGVAVTASALIASLAFYLRFRLPFAVGLVALSATGLIVALALSFDPTALRANSAPLFLCAGLVTLAVAMAFDSADPERETLKTDNAFWLHLVAAPLIVHSLIQLIAGGAPFSIGLFEAFSVIGLVAGLALVAVIIDRRALLVAGLIYLGVAIARLIEGTEIAFNIVLPLTILLLGVSVLVLGTSWQSARRIVVSMVVPNAIAARLPPVSRA
ncbi:MAG: hypothetical protein AAFX39_00955 [Pseudomonadota bacterium]